MAEPSWAGEPPELDPLELTSPDADQSGSRQEADCPHPAEARDYQSGTCAACGAILWD
jgi:hypothetical protein